MGWQDIDWEEIFDDLDGDGYPENDYRGGNSVAQFWALDPKGCPVLGFAVFVPWLTLVLAILCICIFIWEIDRRVNLIFNARN